MAVKSKKEAAQPAVETPVEQTAPETTLTKAQITEAATNNPALAKEEFKLGGRTFKVVHLEYDQYTEFTTYLEPLLKGLASAVTARAGVKIPGIDIAALDKELSPQYLMQMCNDSLPRMAEIVCNMQTLAETEEGQEPDASKLVTAKWIKKEAKSPFVVAKIVMAQIAKNNMVAEFLDFFVSVLPTMLSLNKLAEKPQTK